MSDVDSVGVRDVVPRFTREVSYQWRTAGWGSSVDRVESAFASIEVTSIPTDDSGPDGTSSRAVAASLIASVALMPGCESFEVRYELVPQASGPSRVRMFLTAKALGPAHTAGRVASTAVSAAARLLPQGYTVAAAEAAPIEYREGACVVELRRSEQQLVPTWDFVDAEYYYLLHGDVGDGSGWSRFWQVLARESDPVAISIVFKQTRIDDLESAVLGDVATMLKLYSETRHDYDAIGRNVVYPGDANAQLALENWSARIERLTRPLIAKVAVYALPNVGARIGTALASAIAARSVASLNGAGSHPLALEVPSTVAAEHWANVSLRTLDVVPWSDYPMWDEQSAPHTLRRFTHLFGADEAAGLLVLPVPAPQGAAGFEVARSTAARRARIGKDNGSGVALGQLVDHGYAGGAVSLPLEALNRHVLVVGSPGSGKSTTLHTLLTHLWVTQRVPFLVIESVKHEYRSLLDVPGLGEDLKVFVLGRDDLSPLRLNPLAPPPGVPREVHAGALLAALKTAMPLFPPLPQLLDEAIDRTYARAGWTEESTVGDGIQPPTLRDLTHVFRQVFAAHGYTGESRNMAAAVQVRLGNLLRGSRGRFLDTLDSTDFDELMSRPVVIELDEVADAEDKAIISAFVLDRIRAAARRRGSSGGQLRHVTVLEEAHRLLREPASGGDRVQSSPQADAVRAFSDAIAELRSSGEGFILSSQTPSQLSRTAVANSGTRILHRLETAHDRAGLLDDADASQLDRQIAARLEKGEALVRAPQWDDAELVRVVPPTGVDTGREVSDDVVRDRMRQTSDETRALLPFAMCTRSVCPAGCDPATRHAGQLGARAVAGSAQAIWAEHGPNIGALPRLAAAIVTESGPDLRAAYCVAAQVQATGDALFVQRGVDVRPQVEAALKEEVARHE
jgi:DNA helicase HerA-like ATPase